MAILDIILCIFSTFILGLSYVIVKYGLAYFGPLAITGIRYLIVTVIICPFFIKEMKSKEFPWLKMFALGLNMAIGFQTLIVAAISTGLDVATSVICQQLSVPFTCILGTYFFKDKLTTKNIIGLIISFIGMLVVVGSPTLHDNLVGILLAIASAFFYGFNNIFLKKMNNYHPLLILGTTSLLSFPIMLILSYLIEGITITKLLNAPFMPWFSIIYLAILVSIISFSLWIHLLQKFSVHLITPFSLLAPIFGISASLIILEEPITWNIIIGGTLTITGIFMINIKKFKA